MLIKFWLLSLGHLYYSKPKGCRGFLLLFPQNGQFSAQPRDF